MEKLPHVVGHPGDHVLQTLRRLAKDLSEKRGGVGFGFGSSKVFGFGASTVGLSIGGLS